MATDNQKYKLITIATFHSIYEADICRNYLQSLDIESFLENENTAGSVWGFVNSVGGIELKVREQDVDQAVESLNERDENSVSDSKYEESEREELDDSELLVAPENDENNRFDKSQEEINSDLDNDVDRKNIELLIYRAFLLSLFAYLFLPLCFYSLHLLWKHAKSDAKLSSKYFIF